MKTKVKKKKTSGMTLDRLAELMVDGFDDVREEMRQGFAGVDARFEKVEKRLNTIEHRLDDFEKRISALEMKVTGLYRLYEEDKMQRLDIQSLFDRLEKLEKEVYKNK